MNLKTAMERIRLATHDVSNEYTKTDLVGFINTSIQNAASLLAAADYYELIREVTLHNGDFAPKNMLRTCGSYPIVITSGMVEFLDPDTDELQYRYVSTPDYIPEDATDEYMMPFNNDAVNEAIVRQAIIYALNQNEYNIQQDSALQSAFQQAISAAMSNGRSAAG